ncbi:hypothetical protein GCM10011339_41170 [Echinicola rosea]|uniref:Uncharacterized protein n=1 Tax=Echinicola rosea TaxID=1807691 RepID=A0ABQ1VAY9_9BACT|nr:hypothetical protein GCM10011339_41170 [Echinicola rosea]
MRPTQRPNDLRIFSAVNLTSLIQYIFLTRRYKTAFDAIMNAIGTGTAVLFDDEPRLKKVNNLVSLFIRPLCLNLWNLPKFGKQEELNPLQLGFKES